MSFQGGPREGGEGGPSKHKSRKGSDTGNTAAFFPTSLRIGVTSFDLTSLDDLERFLSDGMRGEGLALSLLAVLVVTASHPTGAQMVPVCPEFLGKSHTSF